MANIVFPTPENSDETLTKRLWTESHEHWGFGNVAASANARVKRESFEATKEGEPVRQSEEIFNEVRDEIASAFWVDVDEIHQWFGKDEEVLATYVDPEFAISLCGEGVTYLYSYNDNDESFFAAATEEALNHRYYEEHGHEIGGTYLVPGAMGTESHWARPARLGGQFDGERIMKEPTTNFEALTQALALAVSADTDQNAQAAKTLAEHYAADLDEEDIERAKKQATELLAATC